jgi:hypothetical protein
MDIREDFNWDASKGRRKLAADKLELLRGEHLKALQAKIRTIVTPETATEVIAWANTAHATCCARSCGPCAIAYARGAVACGLGSQP